MPQHEFFNNYFGKNRIILVFTPDYQDERFQRQQAIFQNSREKLKERDVILVEMNLNDGYGEKELTEAAVKKIRQKFAIKDPEFTVILIGKDGTEKLRYNDVVQPEQLFSLIDSMPMRKEEMRKPR